ncbi:MAG: insulinase family protein [Gemmatimonadetes bacterium]|nr:insulinase family protein [Gemmatimonadota bacterium]MBI2614863.1 insulinase family protein [Gemmatimonadota bacterium]
MMIVGLACLVVASVLLPSPLAAQTGVPYHVDSLPNGLRVILSEDHSTPVVSVDVWYDVGSRNEQVGRSGFAHLFEHMMFQGSQHVGKGQHFQLVERAGGSVNGTTNEDHTAYYQELPANRLNLGLWLEADRMRSLAITPVNFENQRQAVKEERRLRVDNQPYAPALTEGITLLYDSTTCFGYAHSVIGSMADLDSAKVGDVQAFFDLYYAPNNATLTVVGDFDPVDALQLIRQYFGDLPRGREPPPVSCDYDFAAGAKRRVWEDEHANLPAVIIAYRTPAHQHADTPALSLLGTILGGGESSRLNRALVRQARTALAAGTQSASRLGPGFFAAFAVANQGIGPDTLERQLSAEVRRIIDEGVAAEELSKARNQFRAGNMFGRQTTMQVAERLQHYAHLHDSLEDMRTDLDRYLAVTAEDIRRVAATYLVPANSFTIVVVPKGEAGQ